jgi:hypothetical protein
MAVVREISRTPRPGQFILKALREAAGELIEELERISEKDALLAPEGEWSFAQIAAHVAKAEQLQLDYVERILSRRRPILEVVDLYVTPDECRGARSLRGSLYRYAELRQEVVYRLYGLAEEQWERTGEHCYRGDLSLLQLAREQHLHDLEHLWQLRHNQDLLTR